MKAPFRDSPPSCQLYVRDELEKGEAGAGTRLANSLSGCTHPTAQKVSGQQALTEHVGLHWAL